MQEVTPIRIALLYLNDGGRAVDRERVKALAGSIAEIGLRTPLTVRACTRIADGREIDAFEITTGRHRFEAVCRLGWEEVDCIITDDDDLHAELWEIDENLMRAELSPADRASAVARRKAIYEALHPETKHGNPGVSRQVGDTRERTDTDRFTADTAAKTGKSERAVQRDAARGEAIADDVLVMVRGTSLDTGVYLDGLKSLSPDKQREKVRRDLDAAKRPPPKPIRLAPDPINDMEATERQVAALMAAWNHAGTEAREIFRERIDGVVFDRSRAGAA